MTSFVRNLMSDQSVRLIKLTVLGVLLSIFGIAPVAAERVSLCEYWHGNPVWECGFAFLASQARKSGACQPHFESSLPYWSDRDLNSVDPDTLSDSERDKLAKYEENWGHVCQCKNVQIRCAYVRAGGGDWMAFLEPVISNHTCSGTPDMLRSLNFSDGQLTPSC
ncbi:MAG: hypothetical protein OXE94_05715 [Aestuariivita sp.]|nr:hypothetical protein [Aestuariivita sp.]MCY4203631.1 hypothetical protein [Aestuariivita sp.]MCY4347825.1 hypothetical protein [Aestuariivita sp.]